MRRKEGEQQTFGLIALQDILVAPHHFSVHNFLQGTWVFSFDVFFLLGHRWNIWSRNFLKRPDLGLPPVKLLSVFRGSHEMKCRWLDGCCEW